MQNFQLPSKMAHSLENIIADNVKYISKKFPNTNFTNI